PHSRRPGGPPTVRPGKRRFDHLWIELSLAVGCAVSRFALWIALRERGADPEDLARGEAVAFCREGLVTFLAEQALVLDGDARERLARRVARFEARHPTPEERLAALTA
ncbi:MAG: hypothetical protein R3263_08420, partial [Myxococcota bacterium]|nr:hypothetical protein [Myxococcota bacterium]